MTPWCGGGVVFLTDNKTTPTKVVLSFFGLLVGLWQFGYKWPKLEPSLNAVSASVEFCTPLRGVGNIKNKMRM